MQHPRERDAVEDKALKLFVGAFHDLGKELFQHLSKLPGVKDFMKKGGLCQTEIARLTEPAEVLRALNVTNSFVVSAVAGDAYPARTNGRGLIITPQDLFVRSTESDPDAWKQLSKSCEKVGFVAPMVVALPRGFTMRRIPSVATTKTVTMEKFYHDRFTVKIDNGSHVAEWEQLRLKVPQEANKMMIDSEYNALARGMPESCLCTYWRLRVRKKVTGQVVQSAVFRSILVTDPATGEIRPWKRLDGVPLIPPLRDVLSASYFPLPSLREVIPSEFMPSTRHSLSTRQRVVYQQTYLATI